MNKRTSAIFLQGVIVAFGAGVLALMLWEPHLEGVNANATTLSEIYFDDPFLVYAYLASTGFFVGLYYAFKLAGNMGRNELASQKSVCALRTIRNSAILLVVMVAAPLSYLILVRPDDDIAGGVAMGLFIILASGVSATTAELFKRSLRRRIQSPQIRV